MKSELVAEIDYWIHQARGWLRKILEWDEKSRREPTQPEEVNFVLVNAPGRFLVKILRRLDVNVIVRPSSMCQVVWFRDAWESEGLLLVKLMDCRVFYDISLRKLSDRIEISLRSVRGTAYAVIMTNGDVEVRQVTKYKIELDEETYRKLLAVKLRLEEKLGVPVMDWGQFFQKLLEKIGEEP